MNATEVLKTYYKEGSFPIDLHFIAAQNNIKIEYVDSKDDEYCGEIDMDKSPIIIKANANHPETRQRFTIAHELGHYFLGHGSRNRIIDKKANMNSYDPIEYLANDFASKLLMPDLFIQYLLEGKMIKTIGDVAKIFNVSTHAAEIRCKRLGLID